MCVGTTSKIDCLHVPCFFFQVGSSNKGSFRPTDVGKRCLESKFQEPHIVNRTDRIKVNNILLISNHVIFRAARLLVPLLNEKGVR